MATDEPWGEVVALQKRVAELSAEVEGLRGLVDHRDRQYSRAVEFLARERDRIVVLIRRLMAEEWGIGGEWPDAVERMIRTPSAETLRADKGVSGG